MISIGPEEGGPYGPYRQSERTELYKKHAESLVENGYAYRCFCTPNQLLSRAEVRNYLGEATEYDGTCLHVSQQESEKRASRGETHIIRLKDPLRDLETVDSWELEDLVHGVLKLPKRKAMQKKAQQNAWDDTVLLKSDGTPTYHLANVVDDHYMKITHVIRGVEWLISTWKHIALYKAFGWQPPAFAHVGLLMDTQGRKLSKREKAFDLDEMKKTLLPETLINFLALLGWKHNQPSDIFTMEMLEEQFNLRLNRNNPEVSMVKIPHIQSHHAARYVGYGERGQVHEGLQFIYETTTAAVRANIPQEDLEAVGLSDENAIRSRVKDILQAGGKWEGAQQFMEMNRYFFTPMINFKPDVLPKQICSVLDHKPLRKLVNAIIRETYLPILSPQARDSLTPKRVDAAFKEAKAQLVDFLAKNTDIKENNAREKVAVSALSYQLRRWLSGGHSGPGIGDIIFILGRHVSRSRIESDQEAIENDDSMNVE